MNPSAESCLRVRMQSISIIPGNLLLGETRITAGVYELADKADSGGSPDGDTLHGEDALWGVMEVARGPGRRYYSFRSQRPNQISEFLSKLFPLSSSSVDGLRAGT